MKKLGFSLNGRTFAGTFPLCDQTVKRQGQQSKGFAEAV